MAKIMLFGSSTLSTIPPEVEVWLTSYLQQGHEFIVGDRKGTDTAFHMLLSRIGALDNTTLYCMDSVKNNAYNIKSRVFLTSYDESKEQAYIFEEGHEDDAFVIEDVKKDIDIPNNRHWYEYRDRKMIEECSMAIALWDKSSKGTLNNIQLLNIKSIPCYTFTY